MLFNFPTAHARGRRRLRLGHVDFGRSSGGSNAGAVYIIFLKTDGTATNVQKLSNLYGNLNGFYTIGTSDRFGISTVSLGDVNGDSVADLGAGADSDGDGGTAAGAVYMLYLSTDGNINGAQKLSNLYGNFGAFYTLLSVL